MPYVFNKKQFIYSPRDNLLELDLYFEEMSLQTIQQVPAYAEESLFGMVTSLIFLFNISSINSFDNDLQDVNNCPIVN